MKSLAMLTLLAGLLFVTTGCETPGYTASENARRVGRNMSYDLRQVTDDWEDILLMDKPSHLTRWGVQ
jgi:hypothetical protein